VPQQDFKVILKDIQDLLNPSGIFFLGQYGGKDFEGINPEDHYNPKRYFSLMTDAQIQRLVGEVFLIEQFETVKPGIEDEFHFQCLYLRRR
jgi:hypothetical protein